MPRATSEAHQQTVADVGEFGLIASIIRGLNSTPAVSVGPGDDGAVFLINGSAVTSTDILIEGVHFRRDWSSATEIGRKAVAVNAADLEAMGARPVSVVVSLGVPADLPARWVKDFATGFRAEADTAGLALVGGDTSAARDITISVTVIGETADLEPVLRSGATPGEVVAVCGRLGWAAAGLTALGRGFRSPRAAVDSQRVPVVPYGEGMRAARGGATAMIDVSDGLLADLNHIAQASQVWIDVESDAFKIADPVAAVASAVGKNPLDFVLTGGEDHALAACFPMGELPSGWVG
ncbi:thiamine-phosphate kinase, partial [Propionibacterium sp.]|uniref:thiamine-phosphate kinase n=1 Tax=Propionibacterium sp. TaxID=1977903 RepID=UPI0039EB5748